MPAQNNTGRQYDKQHAVTVVAAVALAAHRFVAYDGGYATSAGGVKDCQGVSETNAEIGDALPVVTAYSYLVQTSAAITFGAYVKPGTDGKAAAGTATDCCGRALGAASAADQLIEVQLLPHRTA